METSGRFKSIEEIGEVLIPISGTQASIPLRDIAAIRKAYVEPINNPAYYNGHQAIVLSLFILNGVDAVEFGRRLTKEVQEIEDSLPWGYKLEFATYQPELIQKSVKGMVINVVESVAIVLVVVMLLLGLRTGLIVGSFIPLVMLFGVVTMYALGIDMERMSLATMIIALGMFVDNAIVVSDDIKVNLETGMDRKEAVLKTGNSLSVPLLTSTLTTVFAFGPILLQIGSTGDYTSSLGSVMVILLLASWFFSMFSSTSMCYWFLKPAPAAGADKQQPSDPYQGKFYRIYRKILEISLRHRLLVLAFTGGVFAVSLYAATFIPQAFFPSGDRNQYLIYLDLPAGTRIEETDRTVRKLSAWLQDKEQNPEITGTIAYVGNGGPRFFLSLSPLDPDPFLAFLIVNTETNKEVPELVRRTGQYLLDNFPNVRGRVKSMWLGGSETGLMEVRLSGPDIEVLEKQAGQVMAALRNIPGTIDIKQDWNNRVFTAKVEVDQAQASRAGVTSKDVADSLDVFCRRLDDHQLLSGKCRYSHCRARGQGRKGFSRQPAHPRHPHVFRPERTRQPGGRCVHRGGTQPDRALQPGAHHHRQRQEPDPEGVRDLRRPPADPGRNEISQRPPLGRGRRAGRLGQGPEEPDEMDAALFRRDHLFAGMAV